MVRKALGHAQGLRELMAALVDPKDGRRTTADAWPGIPALLAKP